MLSLRELQQALLGALGLRRLRSLQITRVGFYGFGFSSEPLEAVCLRELGLVATGSSIGFYPLILGNSSGAIVSFVTQQVAS
jgi:hypothetical protein